MKRKTFVTILITVIAVIVVLAVTGMTMPTLNSAEQVTNAAPTKNYSSFTDTTEYKPTTSAKHRYFEPMDSLSGFN